VKLVSSKKNFVTTLAIGAGANDVNMITSANIQKQRKKGQNIGKEL